MPPAELPIKSTETTAPHKDKNYYFDDGDCIIQAENHLFKIHRFLLERGSQIFKDLYSLPQPPASPSQGIALEGGCEDNPLIFQDSADDFRALCWGLYARPDDILDQQSSKMVDIARMVRLLIISHKYEVRYLWDWSLRVVRDHLSSIPGELISSCDGSWSEVERLLKLSSHWPDIEFIGQRIEEEWFMRIRSSDFTQAREAFIAALDASEHSPSLYQFHVRAYYTYVNAIWKPRTSTSVDMNNAMTFIDSSVSDLGELRTSRLSRGSFSLSQLRSKLSVAPRINDNPSCNRHSTICEPGWAAWWKNNIPNNIHDPGELIQSMMNRSASSGGIMQEDDGYYYSEIVPCSAQIIEQLKGMMKGFNDTLGNHFMLPRL